MLLGRERERLEIGQALVRARSGGSTVIALVGEPGIGKTALIDEAAERAAGMRLLRARGIESEAHIPFGSLLELLRPALIMLEKVPEPQAVALGGALALRRGPAQDRFAIGAATLSLLAAYAEPGPVAVLIDDAHWLDESSAQALLFAFRRLVADPIAVFLAVREGEPSLIDGSDLPVLHLSGLSGDEAAALLHGLPAETARRLHGATAGNPLALLELAPDFRDLALAPEGAPVLVSTRISHAFLQRAGSLDEAARRALVLAATSDSGDLPALERAAARLGIDLAALAVAETAGLVTLGTGTVEFRHPLARSAIYAGAPAAQRRDAHRALAAALPDRDVDRRAWHLAAAAIGTDDSASAALEQAGARGRDRSAYATAAAAFERAGQLAAGAERRARLLWEAGEAAWLAGLADRAVSLLDQARAATGEPGRLAVIDELAGLIATRRGPVMRGHAILTAAAERADPERAVAMLAEASLACFLAGDPAEMLSVAERARALLPEDASVRARFLAAICLGMARILGGNAAAGAAAVHEGITLADNSPGLRDDLQLIPWLTLGPLFLRETDAGRWMLDHALRTARDRAAVGELPFVLNLIARDHAGTDRWAVAEATYREAIDLARESGQQTGLVFGLTGLAWLQARRGRELDCRACVAEALRLNHDLGTQLNEVWAIAALGELELGLGDAARAAEHFERQQQLLLDLGITDVDLSPAAELVEAYARLGREDEARQVADRFTAAARAKGQPWSYARALRSQGMLAPAPDFPACFEQALRQHKQTPDVFETARTQLAYGERLRRARDRILAREQLRAAADAFERLDAAPRADRARAELAATGETLRRRDSSTVEELTPQELQIALLLTSGKTTRETAAALFLSPKTVEYHLRHVYQKLGIHSREELAQALAAQGPQRAGRPVLRLPGRLPVSPARPAQAGRRGRFAPARSGTRPDAGSVPDQERGGIHGGDGDQRDATDHGPPGRGPGRDLGGCGTGDARGRPAARPPGPGHRHRHQLARRQPGDRAAARGRARRGRGRVRRRRHRRPAALRRRRAAGVHAHRRQALHGAGRGARPGPGRGRRPDLRHRRHRRGPAHCGAGRLIGLHPQPPGCAAARGAAGPGTGRGPA
jgi:DNA-binding CsgD family transcriptional regulator